MELAIEPIEKIIPTTFKWNYDELKKDIAKTMAIYKNASYTDETMKEAKKDVAKLRKFSRALDDKRKEVKKLWNTPVAEFEGKVKELTGLVQEPITLIDTQVKEYEQKIIDDKLKEAKDYFTSKAKKEGIDGFLSWSVVEQPNFSNLSKTLNNIKKEVDETIEQVKKDWAAIEGLESKYESDMKLNYVNTLDLQEAIALNQRLIKQAEERAEYERKRKEEEARRAEERARQRKEQAKKPDLFVKKEEVKPEHKPEPIKEVEELHTLSFKVTGTAKELMQLSEYMKSNNIQFEKI